MAQGKATSKMCAGRRAAAVRRPRACAPPLTKQAGCGCSPLHSTLAQERRCEQAPERTGHTDWPGAAPRLCPPAGSAAPRRSACRHRAGSPGPVGCRCRCHRAGSARAPPGAREGGRRGRRRPEQAAGGGSGGGVCIGVRRRPPVGSWGFSCAQAAAQAARSGAGAPSSAAASAAACRRAMEPAAASPDLQDFALLGLLGEGALLQHGAHRGPRRAPCSCPVRAGLDRWMARLPVRHAATPCRAFGVAASRAAERQRRQRGGGGAVQLRLSCPGQRPMQLRV